MLKLTKTRDVKTPERKGLNAGFDFFVPNDIPHDDVLGGFYINPNSGDKIPSGIKVRVPRGYCLIGFNKSGIAANYNLLVGACVVDENYSGEIFLNVINCGKDPVFIEPGTKLVQFILIRQEYHDVEVYDSEESLYKDFDKSERGDKGFGSTGTK